MVKILGKRLLPLMLAIMLIMAAMPLNAFATTIETVLDGQITITDTSNTVTESSGTVTATAKGSLFSKATNTITITNETGSTVELSFDYSAVSYNSFTIDGDAATSASGTYTKVLGAGASITIVLKSNSGLSGTTATLTMNKFSLTVASASSNVTFNYDTDYGSITVDGVAVANAEVKEIALAGAALVATPASGATFLGWVNAADGSILSTATSYTVTPAADMTVKAVFVGANSAPHFVLSSLTETNDKSGIVDLSTIVTYYLANSPTHIFDDLAAATEASKNSNNSKAIVLMNSGTLPAGTYTIPSGSTLLIPFDDANTLYTTQAQGREHTSSETTSHSYTVYRKLTMADGANIVLNGVMSLSAKHLYAQGNRTGGGSPVDAISQVEMLGDSSITVNNGGALYVYGYIYGSGSVTAKSGATVYENFQIMDFRGGSQSTSMENGVFPLSQYYVQNIEVPLTLEYGAREYSYTTIYMSSLDYASSVGFIGPDNSMFNLTSGSVVKRYDGSTDRLLVELNGELTVSPIEMQVGSSSINSKDYELPINGNISITAKSGSNILMNQDIAMFPGSEIILEQGANCTVGTGINIYIYDADNWGLFTGAGTDTTFKPVTHAMSRTYNRTNADLVDAKIQVDGTIDASAGYVYTTSGGANVFSTGTGAAKVTAGTQTVTHQFIYTGTQYVEIPITPVKFKNADSSYVQGGTDTYTYSNGKWSCTDTHVWQEVTVDATCIKDGIRYDECTICHDIINETIIPASDDYHDFVKTEKAPTCTENGFVEETCSHCGLVNRVESEATGHSYNSVVTEPTCTAQGYTTHTCTVCGNTKVDTYVDPTGHSYSDWAVRTQAGCESEGVEYRTCSVCSNEETRAITAKGHSYNSVVTEPTCTAQGYTTYTCSVCSHSYVADEVSAKGHDYDAVVTAPTCTSQGYTTYTCTVCGDNYVGDYVEATGHNMSDWITDTLAGCTTDGAQHKECSNCSYTESMTIVATGHSYSDVITAPTCTEEGYTTHTCANCSNSYVDSYVDALGHSYGDWIVVENATHTADGLKEHTCHCGHTETTNIPTIICDADGDGDADAYELAMMRKFLVETLVPTEEQKVLFDMNDDGIISIKDLVRLKKYIAGIPF